MSECAAIGTNEVVACEVGVCVQHSCVDRGPCDGNEDCESPEVCVEGTCSGPPDAALTPAFDAAYPNVWEFSVNDPIPFDLMIVNRGVSPLSMSTLQVRSLSDDHPTAFVRLTTTPSQADIQPSFAGGLISPIAEPVMIDSGLVTEQRTDTNSSYVTIDFVDAPDGTYDINVDAVLALDGLDIPIRFLVHRLPLPEVYANPKEAIRTEIAR